MKSADNHSKIMLELEQTLAAVPKVLQQRLNELKLSMQKEIDDK